MPRGQPLNTMNPFSNNKPRLTASERIRNKRDAAIYQGEKQRFQRGKNKCRNRNVKFYKNIAACCKNVDLIIIHTEWNEFKQLNFKKITKKRNLKVFDMRNLYTPKDMKKNK